MLTPANYGAGVEIKKACVSDIFKVYPMRILSIFIIFLLYMAHPLQAAEKSLFWQLESPQGKVSYLFGTIHTDDNRVTDFSPYIIDALKNVDYFVMEVAETPDRQSLQMSQGDLTAYLSESEISQVRTLAEMHVMAFNQVIHMKPWLLAVIFDLPKPQTPFAQDYLLKSKAEELDKQIEGLESVQEHFGAMDSFSVEDQLIMLRAVLKRSQAQKEKDFERLMRAYLSGDAQRVTNIDSTLTKGMLPDALWQRMRIKLLDERNVVMGQRSVDKAMQSQVFIAVGAAHLSGKTGLLQAFQNAGFKLTPLKK